MTLVEFLLARIAEDEERVRNDYPFLTWDVDWEEVGWDKYREPTGQSWHSFRCSYGIGELGLDCDCGVPARVLAECAAKRELVRLYGTTHGPSLVTRLLALPYADHADYQESWKP